MYTLGLESNVSYIQIYYIVDEISVIIIQSNIDEPTRCNNDLLIYKISSTCFGQYFAHHQERETEIFTTYGILNYLDAFSKL